jgi:hypothetical protein
LLVDAATWQHEVIDGCQMEDIMKIEILGDGCSKCAGLRKRVHEAIEDLGIEADVETVVDPERMADYQIRTLPMLVIDGRLKAAKPNASLDDVKELLQPTC